MIVSFGRTVEKGWGQFWEGGGGVQRESQGEGRLLWKRYYHPQGKIAPSLFPGIEC